MLAGNTSTALQFPVGQPTVSATPEIHLASSQHALPQRERREINQVLRGYMVTDALALAIGFICAWALSAIIDGMLGLPVVTLSGYGSLHLIKFCLISGAVLFWLQHTDSYRVRMPFWVEINKIVNALGFAMIVDGFLQFASKQDFSRLWLMSAWMVAAGAMILLRNILRRRMRQAGTYRVSTLLIGAGQNADHTRAALKSEPNLGYEITTQIKDLPQAFLQAGKSWETLCKIYGVDYVIVAFDGPEWVGADAAMAQLAREAIPFSVSPPLHHMPVMGMVPQYFLNHDVMLLTRSSGLEQPISCFFKRAIDILVSGSALLVLSPIMLLVALQVKRDGGPAIYGHSRLGRNRSTFSCLKFRSMVRNGDDVLTKHLAENPEAQQEWNATRKLKDDPRVTRIGNFLRSTSLDELPQLWNVLRGDMSLVGPRPIVTAEISKYDGDIAHYYRVRPGITGLWQVSGRSDVSYPQRVHMDSWYVRNWSMWHDIAIICKTFPALLKRSGAY